MDAYIIAPKFMLFNLVFSLAFAIVTLLVARLSYKMYKLTSRKELKLFTGAFSLFSLAYFLQLIFGLAIQYRLVEMMGRAKMRAVFPLLSTVTYIHVLLFAIGLTLLAFMTCKTKSNRLLVLLLGLVLIPLFVTSNLLPVFHLVSTFMLLFILLFYYNNYKHNKNLKTELVLLAFIFLLIGNMTFIFAVRQGLFFIFGRSLELIAYICILANLRLLKK
jgi:hypothetical protein